MDVYGKADYTGNSFDSSWDVESDSNSFGISLSLAAVLVSLPFYWVNLPGTSFSILNFAILAFVLVALYRPAQLVRNLVEFWSVAKLFHVLYLLYVLVCIVSALGRIDLSNYVQEIIRIPYYFCCYLIFGASLLQQSPGKIRRTVLISTLTGICLFVGYSEFVFRSLGTSMLTEVRHALIGKGSTSAPNLLRIIINYGQGEVNLDREAGSLLGTVRNAISAILTFYSFVTLACLRKSNLRSYFAAVAVATTVGMSFCVLLVLMSRSNLIAVSLGLAVASVIMLVSPFVESKFKLMTIYASILGVAAIGGGFIALRSDSIENAVGGNVERFSNVTEDVRFANYRSAFEAIKKRPGTGYGPGAVAKDGLPVHNLVLAAWFESGFIGFFVALAVFIELVRKWMEATLMRVNLRFMGAMEMAFMPAIAVSPILRRLIGGESGRFMLFELIPLAFFFVLMIFAKRMVDVESATIAEESSGDFGSIYYHDEFLYDDNIRPPREMVEAN
jgi:O-Antigen ligase